MSVLQESTWLPLTSRACSLPSLHWEVFGQKLKPTVNLPLSITEALNKLNLSFKDQRFRSFTKGFEMSPFSYNVLALKKKDKISEVLQEAQNYFLL